MTIKRFLSIISVFALFIVTLNTAWATGEVEFILEKRVTAMVPAFMTGHLGDPAWIQGFHVEGDLYFKDSDTKIGSFTSDVLLLNPPMKDEEAYEEAFITMANLIPGAGTFQVTALGLSLGNSTDDGGIIFSWSGSISNGTGSLQNVYGLSAGSATANIYTGAGNMTEVLNMRVGY